MRKLLIAAAAVALSAGAGLAIAQNAGAPGGPNVAGSHGGRGAMVFQADANHDGAVTRPEFDAGREAQFARLDANRDGELTREERRAGRGEGGERGGHHRGRHGAMGLDHADANHDGAITRAEFLAGPTAMFARMDANHDGVIQASERPQHREAGQGGERQRANPDANGDRQLSHAEWSAMGGAMFERMDADHDGRITQEEAGAMHHRRGAE